MYVIMKKFQEAETNHVHPSPCVPFSFKSTADVSHKLRKKKLIPKTADY